MKVLFSCSVPFFLAHGGSQTLTEALMRELSAIGVEVEPARWWDENQTGDVLHYIARPSTLNVRLAHQKGMKIVFTDLLDQTASRSKARLFAQRSFNRTAGRLLTRFTGQLNWEVYREADAVIFAVPHEKDVAEYLFNADPARGHVIPHGLEKDALSALSKPQAAEDFLVSVATIAERKNTVLLAEAALLAKVPIVFLGRPYSEDDPYFLRFTKLIDEEFVRYPGFVSTAEKFRYLRGARGFALMSQFESGCIAVFEAAAAGLPLLLSDLRWARRSYPQARSIAFAQPSDTRQLTEALQKFYREARREPGSTFPVLSWKEIAGSYLNLYQQLVGQN